MTTESDARRERLTAASDSIAEELTEALQEHGKRAAANMLMMYGSKSVLDAGGFIYAVQNATEAALLFMLEEEWATLTPKGQAAAELVESRKAKRALAVDGIGEEKAAPAPNRIPGAYL